MAEETRAGVLRVHVATGSENGQLTAAVRATGATLVPLAEAEALVWNRSRDEFPDPLPDSIRWVQLPSAGVETWFAAGVFDTRRVWTSAAGAYAEACAEHALTLLLLGVRGMAAAVAQERWERRLVEPQVGTLRAARVGVIGAGGIGQALIRMLAPLGAEVTAVNRSGRPVAGAHRTLPAADLDAVWDEVDHAVLAAPATPATHHLVGARELARLGPRGWVVNVARGSLIDTEALVKALHDGTVGGAGLDVTDPEPLPDGHPLWSEPRAVITPHVANPPQAMRPAFAAYVADNVRRRLRGEPLRGVIDLDAGY